MLVAIKLISFPESIALLANARSHTLRYGESEVAE